ncbi:MAG: hypothetical protein ABI901_12605 [Roseiflexaceae bacterium]
MPLMLLLTVVLSFLAGMLLQPVLVRSTLHTPGELILVAPLVTTPLPQAPPTIPASNATYLAINVQEYPAFIAYWKRDLWEQAVHADSITEDFSLDTADYGELSFPYLTGHGLLLQGQTTAQILDDSTLLGSGTSLHFRDWKDGLRIGFPNDGAVRAFGFDYRPSEAWKLSVSGTDVLIPKGRKGFIGIVFRDDYPKAFVLSSTESAQGGLSVDNITFLPTGSS